MHYMCALYVDVYINVCMCIYVYVGIYICICIHPMGKYVYLYIDI